MSVSFGPGIPFVNHMGFTLERFENGHSEMHYAPLPEHLNSFDMTHGGALMTLLDVAMATAARSVDPELGVFTIEMKTSFMKAAKTQPGEHLVAKGELIQRTKKWLLQRPKFLMHKVTCAHIQQARSNMQNVARLSPNKFRPIESNPPTSQPRETTCPPITSSF